jgi:centromere/kinetochore protein ZW10
MASSDPPAAQMAQALVDFSVQGAFPEDTVSSLTIDPESLPTAIKALADAKAKLQVGEHTRWAQGAC